MSTAAGTAWRPGLAKRAAQARALAGALAVAGFTVRVIEGKGFREHPCVQVSGCRARCGHATAYVYAAPRDPLEEAGAWEFTVAPGPDPADLEPVAGIGDVGAAAAGVGRIVPCFGGPCPVCADPGEAA